MPTSSIARPNAPAESAPLRRGQELDLVHEGRAEGSVFARALSAYFGVLDGATLEEIAMNDQACAARSASREIAVTSGRAAMAIDFAMTPRQRNLKYETREFAREVLRPVADGPTRSPTRTKRSSR